MLVLSRKLNETICIGQDIQIKIVKIRGSVVGLGISAPENVKVMRKELVDKDRATIAAGSSNLQGTEAGQVTDQKLLKGRVLNVAG